MKPKQLPRITDDEWKQTQLQKMKMMTDAMMSGMMSKQNIVDSYDGSYFNL